MVLLSKSPASLLSGSLATLLLLSACGGSSTPEPQAPQYELDEDSDPENQMHMMQEFGGMNEDKVNRTVERLYPHLSDCLMQGSREVAFLGGDIAFLVQVNLRGEAVSVHAENSTLGHHATEQCMLKQLKSSRWPKPVGGYIGLARTSMGFDPPSDVREPTPLSEADLGSNLETIREQLSECGSGGPFTLTVYVNPQGKVLSAGVAHTDAQGEHTAECLVRKVETLPFPSPGSWAAKISFQR